LSVFVLSFVRAPAELFSTVRVFLLREANACEAETPIRTVAAGRSASFRAEAVRIVELGLCSVCLTDES